jgi:hypothetical protein
VAPVSASESPLRQLDLVLGQVADAMATLSDRDWDQLCTAEACELRCLLQFFAVEEVDDKFPPALTIGNRILELFATRYPHLADGEGFGTA